MSNDSVLDDILTVPRILDFELSLDKLNLAYVWLNVHSNGDVFYIDLEKDSDPIVLTETPEFTRMLEFYPKSKAIIVAEDKGRNERHQLFRININEPKKMIPLTDEDPNYFLRWGSIHPSEKWIFYGVNYDFELEKEIEQTWMYKHNLESGEKIPLAKPKKPAWTYPELNSSGNNIIYTRKDLHPKGMQIWLTDFEGTDDREILNFGEKSRVTASWVPGKDLILFMSDSKNNSIQKHFSVGIYNIKTNEIEWILDDSNKNVENIFAPRFGTKVLIYLSQKARTLTAFYDILTKKLDYIPLIQGNLIPKYHLENKTWLGYYYSSTQPIDIVKFNFNDITPSKLVSLTKVWQRSKLTKEQFIQAEDFDWLGDDGLPIHGWLYQPKKSNGKTIVFVHGGPTAHSEDEIDSQIQYYLNRGFVVLDPNYRGSTGYNFDFEDSIRKNGWGSDEQNDIITGIKTLIEKGIATKGKIGITGTSYGGYSSWCAITRNPKEIIGAAIPICGMTDLIVDYETTRPDLRPYSEEMIGGSPTEIPEKYYERSPINFVKNIKGALLIIQGARDPNVTPKNVDEVKKRLEENKIKYELLIFDDEGHGILRKKNLKILYKKIADFFEQNL
ncbi:MAG: S9 family peptidase [Asgard group archaeon]|nr:S9 family peptidase [Asgard group archaeon]